MRIARPALGLLTTLLVSERLHAEPSSDPDPSFDVAVPTGIVLTALGSAALVTGGVVYGTSPEDIPSNPPLDVGNDERVAGSVLIGFGAGGIAAGVPAILAGLFARHEHMSDGRTVAGVVLLGLAAANAGIGTALYVNRDLEEPEFPASIAWGLGGGFFSVGLPLLVSGAPPRDERAETFSPAMENASYALFALGGSLLIGASLGLTIQPQLEDCGDGPCGESVVSAALLPVGATMLATATVLVSIGGYPGTPPW